jgi:hypothetical protein
MPDQDLFNELSFYTLEHGRSDPAFIHQYAVDAFTAQQATEETKPIATAFALIGLYLHIEKGYTGRQVQLAHMQMAKTRKLWPSFVPPSERGSVTVADALSSPAGTERDRRIDEWCASVWQAWRDSHQQVRELARAELGVQSRQPEKTRLTYSHMGI